MGKTPTSTVGKALPGAPRKVLREEGFALAAVLVASAVLMTTATVAALLTSYEVRHEREEELIFRGRAYRDAVRDYYLSAPEGSEPVLPDRPEDLLSDPRFLHKRHLRSLYPDPMGTGWRWVRTPEGKLAGVASRSRGIPAKKTGFPQDLGDFSKAERYSDWVFVFQP